MHNTQSVCVCVCVCVLGPDSVRVYVHARTFVCFKETVQI